jgi:hypothetical protein
MSLTVTMLTVERWPAHTTNLFPGGGVARRLPRVRP